MVVTKTLTTKKNQEMYNNRPSYRIAAIIQKMFKNQHFAQNNSSENDSSMKKNAIPENKGKVANFLKKNQTSFTALYLFNSSKLY